MGAARTHNPLHEKAANKERRIAKNERKVERKFGAESGGRARGRACIMHSSRVEDLKAVLLASAYLGLTNSLITPPWRRSSSA